VTWKSFDSGSSIGSRGSENGLIVRDEEHEDGARITLEQGGDIAPFSITCGIYGSMVHTRFFASESEARAEFDLMKSGLAEILSLASAADAAQAQVTERIERFIERFPT
jgi:hypothetical protein